MCIQSHVISACTVQLRGKLTLASDSLASATAYTRECERGHSRTSVECSRVLHPSLACYSRVLDPSLACLILASARPLTRVCYLRLLDRSLSVLLATARPLARVLLASVGSSSRALTAHGPARAAVSARVTIARALTVLLWPSEPPRFLFRCSWIRALFSEPPCFFSEPAPRYLLRAPCSRPPSRPCALFSEPRALCSRHPNLVLAVHSRVIALALAEHSRVRALALAHFPKTLACESHLTRE